MTRIEAIAEWAADVAVTDIPARVLDLARAQRRSVLGAIAASSGDRASRDVLAAVAAWAGSGPAPLIGAPTPARVTPGDAAYAATALSVALDFDDYVCFGHTGHSAVLVPIVMAAETGRDGRDQLADQVIANEIEGRLGGAALLGPMNGQLWAFIHAAGAALAAARSLRLDRRQLAHAMAIALAHPVRATVPGFMAPDSKLLVAAEPTATGIRAARLAAAGVTGPLDALDDDRGALGALSFAPLRSILGGLGEGWLTTTLSVKPYPGCAYVDTTIDALLDVIGERTFDPEDVEVVEVEASMLTCGMDALSAPYASATTPTPVTVTFSVGWNVAIVLTAGRLTEAEVSAAWLTEQAARLNTLRQKTRLTHAPEMTARAAAGFARVLPGAGLARELGVRRLLAAARQVRHEHPGLGMGAADLIGLLRHAGGEGLGAARHLGRTRWWDPDALRDFEVAFPARVRIRLASGEVLEGRSDTPRGGAGNAAVPPEVVARTKLERAGPLLWGAGGTDSVQQAVDADDAKLYELLVTPETT